MISESYWTCDSSVPEVQRELKPLNVTSGFSFIFSGQEEAAAGRKVPGFKEERQTGEVFEQEEEKKRWERPQEAPQRPAGKDGLLKLRPQNQRRKFQGNGGRGASFPPSRQTDSWIPQPHGGAVGSRLSCSFLQFITFLNRNSFILNRFRV